MKRSGVTKIALKKKTGDNSHTLVRMTNEIASLLTVKSHAL